MVYNLSSKKTKLLLKGTKGLYQAQCGLGRIVGVNQEKEIAYMPAYFGGEGTKPRNHLVAVDLNTGVGRIHERGREITRRWFVKDDGTVLAREDYNNESNSHEVYAMQSGKWQLIHSEFVEIPSKSFWAVSSDNKSLLFRNKNDDRSAVYSIKLMDGTIDGPLFKRDNADIASLVKDVNKKVIAVKYTGLKPAYEFMDQHNAEYFEQISSDFASSSVFYLTATADKTKMIVLVSGSDAANEYKLFDTQTNKLLTLASGYPNIDKVGPVESITYAARDGLPIPAIVTSPPIAKEEGPLPLIALPHGGPESYDSLKFKWLAQYFAAKGYLVLQPNFRGSTGFGYEFRDAGRGKWGKEMQDDITDGVKALVDAGYVDPERVCIVGWSYGGYAALAGGAFTPEVYRCVIAIAGVSDIPKMLDEDIENAEDHWVVSYWKEVIGDVKSERDALKAVSPLYFADNFKAPVLLIHGKDDLVVPVSQSKKMFRALKKSDKEVQLVTFKGGDHGLFKSSTRLKMLKAVDEFLNKHNPI